MLRGVALSRARDQGPNATIEQQLAAAYHLTKVGTQGGIIQPTGSVLIVQKEKLRAIPSSYGGYYWASSYKAEEIPSRG